MKQRFKNFFSGFVVAGFINIVIGVFYWWSQKPLKELQNRKEDEEW